jgi:hypothetical protein
MGSRAGSPNRNKKFLLNKLQDMYGDDFNPVIKMAENAIRLQELADVTPDDGNVRKSALDGWDKVAQYVEPKLKAVEVTGEGGGPLILNMSEWSDNQIDDYIRKHTDK